MNVALIFSIGRKDDRGLLRFWLGKPAIDWMQHLDLTARIILWVAFDFPGLPYPDFGLLNILRNGRTGFRCSGAPPIRAGRPGAQSRLSDRSLGPQLCAARRSLPAGEILPLAHTNGSPLRLVKHKRGFCHTNVELLICCWLQQQQHTFISLLSVVSNALVMMLRHKACSFINVSIWPEHVCEVKHNADYFCWKETFYLKYIVHLRCCCWQTCTVQISSNKSGDIWFTLGLQSKILINLNQH